MGKVYISFLFVLSTFALYGQRSLNFHYLHTIPLGEFEDNLMHRPSGIAFEYMISPLKNQKFQFGAAFSVSMYQNEDHSGDVSIDEYQKAYVETNEDDCFYTYQGIARYYITDPQKFIRPYVQGQIGGATFFSSLTLTEDSEEAFSADNRTHGSTLLTGLGGGMAIRLLDVLYLDASLTYNSSGQTTYRSSPESNPAAQYRLDLSSHQNTSKVNHLALKVGMNIVF